MFPLHVLVMDEDKAELDKVTRILTNAGHRVTARNNTLGALADILALRPDLVLLDPAARRLRGDDLTLLIGHHPEAADTGVIFYCAGQHADVRPRGTLGVISKAGNERAFLEQFDKLTRQYPTAALPREDRAVIAERRFSGKQRVASTSAMDQEQEQPRRRSAAPR
jgi:CheY-like chemotaxis protein